MGFSGKQVNTLQRPLHAAHIRKRQINGRELTYIEGWHAIAEANRIFGFDNWDRETVEARCVLSREAKGTFVAVYLSKVRITVRADGQAVVREGHGSGEARGGSPGEAHDAALKTAETDATKRALATFGKPFGLSLYLSSKGKARGAATGPWRQLPTVVDVPSASIANVGSRQSHEVAVRVGGESNPPAPALQPSLARNNDAQDKRSIESKEQPILESGSSLQPATETSGPEGPLAKAGIAEPNCRPGPTGASAGNRSFGENAEKTAAATEVGTTLLARVASRIDKSGLAFPIPRRYRDKEHLRYVASQACLVCSRVPSDAHHLRFAQPKGLGQKVSDEFTVPLCRVHHDQLHRGGKEIDWWIDMEIDPLPIALDLWQESLRKRGRAGRN